MGLCVLALSACQEGRTGGNTLTASERAACLASGGTPTRDGMQNNEFCAASYADGGKVCTRKSDCLGLCFITEMTETTGECARTDNPFGCYSYLNDDGEAESICVD